MIVFILSFLFFPWQLSPMSSLLNTNVLTWYSKFWIIYNIDTYLSISYRSKRKRPTSSSENIESVTTGILFMTTWYMFIMHPVLIFWKLVRNTLTSHYFSSSMYQVKTQVMARKHFTIVIIATKTFQERFELNVLCVRILTSALSASP